MYMGTKYAFYLPSFSVRKESSLFCESWTMVFKAVRNIHRYDNVTNNESFKINFTKCIFYHEKFNVKSQNSFMGSYWSPLFYNRKAKNK